MLIGFQQFKGDEEILLILIHPFLAIDRALIFFQRGQFILCNEEQVMFKIYQPMKFTEKPELVRELTVKV